MGTPEEIKEHSDKFVNGSWRNYSFEELGNFVHLLTKRANHRTDELKASKDLHDASNYLVMMQAKFNEQTEGILDKFKPKTEE